MSHFESAAEQSDVYMYDDFMKQSLLPKDVSRHGRLDDIVCVQST